MAAAGRVPRSAAVMACSRWSRLEHPTRAVDRRGLLQANRMAASTRLAARPFLRQKVQTLCQLHVGLVVWPRSIGSTRGTAMGWRSMMPTRHRPPDADADAAHALGGRTVDKLTEILARKAGRHRVPGTWVEQVIAHLGRIQSIAIDHFVQRCRVAERSDAGEFYLYPGFAGSERLPRHPRGHPRQLMPHRVVYVDERYGCGAGSDRPLHGPGVAD